MANKSLSSLNKLASFQRKTHVCFSRKFINVLAPQRKGERHLLLSQKAPCVSLMETHNSIKKLNTLSKKCADSPKM